MLFFSIHLFIFFFIFQPSLVQSEQKQVLHSRIYCTCDTSDLSSSQHSPSPVLSWDKSFGGTCGGEVPGGISSSGLSSICSPTSCSPSGKSPAGCTSSPPSSSGSCTFSSTRSQSWRGAATGGHEWRKKKNWKQSKSFCSTKYKYKASMEMMTAVWNSL